MPKKCCGPFVRSRTPSRTRFASSSLVWVKEFFVIELVDANDSRAVRNKNNVLGFYDLVINKKRAEESVSQFIDDSYVQHNPLIADGATALGQFFGKVTKERPRARVEVHRIIA